jgi:hypothetical protein
MRYTMLMDTRIIAPRGLSLGLALALLAASLACSFSYSSKSFSKSSKGISKSASASSKSSSGSISESSGSEETRYREDVEEFTKAWVSSGGGGPESNFLGAIGGFAEKRGITDWESDVITWEGIGRGLGRAKLSDAQLEAYKYSWADGDSEHMALIQRGYDATR